MKQMLVSSFNNTLISKDESISLPTMLAIDEIRNNDILFVVATSSLLRTIIDYNESYIFSDYIISYNGAYIYDIKKDKTIFKKNLPSTILKKLSKLKQNDMAFLTLNDTYYIGKQYNYDFPIDITDINDFIEFHKKDVYEVLIHYKKKDLDEIIRYIKQFNNINYFFRKKGKDTYIEIVYKDIDKYNSTKIICDKENIDINDVISIGNGTNDYELVKNTIGNCIKNGEKEIKKIADYVTHNEYSEGVKEVIEKYFD